METELFQDLCQREDGSRAQINDDKEEARGGSQLHHHVKA